jgi:hypothetical protein
VERIAGLALPKVRLAEEMLELQKKRQQAEAGKQDARFALQKRIQELDEEIDAPVGCRPAGV